MLNKGDLLGKNIKEFYAEGKRAFERSAYNSATSLFFKALAVLADWCILSKEGFIPKNHTERFNILKQKYPEVYKILDKDFPSYQQSYTINIDKETSEILKNDTETIAKKVGFKLD